MRVKKIISGGQTGADQGGLEAGLMLGLETGGTAPKGWRTEQGPALGLKTIYGLVEDKSDAYPPRTWKNIRDSDGTVLLGNTSSPGSKLTSKYCKTLLKPCLILVDLECLDEFGTDLLEWLETNSIQTLNVAGNRESTNPGIQIKVRDFLVKVLKED
jgi:hypothetical protein